MSNHSARTVTTRACVFCGETSTVSLTARQSAAIEANTPIQEAVPELSEELRELLISGTHPSCWSEVFDQE